MTLPDHDLIDCMALLCTKHKRGWLYCQKHGVLVARMKRIPRNRNLWGWLNGIGKPAWRKRGCLPADPATASMKL